MKYIRNTDKDRSYVSPNWNQRYLRGIQCILNATHGVVSPKKEFFMKAFGRNYNEFQRLITMPDNYIIYRDHFENDGAKDWHAAYSVLSDAKRRRFEATVFNNKSPFADIRTGDHAVDGLLDHYVKAAKYVHVGT